MTTLAREDLVAIQFPNRATTVQVPVPVPVPVLALVLVRIQSITQPAKHMRVRLLIVQLLVQLSDRRQQHDLILRFYPLYFAQCYYGKHEGHAPAMMM